LVEQRFHLLKELNCMRQLRVLFERRFVYPMWVKVKEARVPDWPKAVNFQTPRFLTGSENHLSHRLAESVFTSLAGVESTKDE
jgi:hypothetical protein